MSESAMKVQGEKGREKQVLLLCARVHMDSAQAAELQALAAGELNWEFISELAARNKVLPLYYRNAQKHLQAVIQEATLQTLRDQVKVNAAKNLLFVSTLHFVVQLFSRSNIDVLVFKGPVLAASVYGDIGLRSFSDIDLLVSRRDLNQAIELLREEGFYTDIDLRPQQYRRLVDAGHHAVLIRAGVPIELHWELSGRYFAQQIDLAAVWPNSVEVVLAGQRMRTLGAEDLLVYLCVHGCRHYWLQLDAVCCINELISQRPKLNWQMTVDIATRQGALKMVLLGLRLARKMLGTRLPRQVEHLVASNPRLNKEADALAEKMFDLQDERNQTMRYRRYVAYHSMLIEKKIDLLRFILRPLLNTTHSDWQWVRLPASLSFLYYVLRPFRLVVKYSKRALSR